MQVIGMVSTVTDEQKFSQDGQEYRVRALTIEGLRLKVGGKLMLPAANREVKASVSVEWKKSQTPKPDGSDNIYAVYHCAGWAYM